MQTHILQTELELLFVWEKILCELYSQAVGNEEAMKKGQDLRKTCNNNFITNTFSLPNKGKRNTENKFHSLIQSSVKSNHENKTGLHKAILL